MYLTGTQVDEFRWLLTLVESGFARLFAMRNKQLTALLVPDYSHRCSCLRCGWWYVTKSPSFIYCFLHVHGHSKIDYTFKFFDQYAWIGHKLSNWRIPEYNRSSSCRTTFSAVIETLSNMIVKLKKTKALFQSRWLNTALLSLPTTLPSKLCLILRDLLDEMFIVVWIIFTLHLLYLIMPWLNVSSSASLPCTRFLV